MKAKLFIVERDAGKLAYVAALFGGHDNVNVAGTHLSGRSALDGLCGRPVDVVLTESRLADMPGEEFIEKARRVSPTAAIVVHSICRDKKPVQAAFRAGACGYIVKGASALEIISAVQTAAAGGMPISPAVMPHVFCGFNPALSLSRGASLTEREKEVVRGMARGLTEARMAEAMALSPHTVHSHLKKIYRKLDAKNRSEAVLKAHSYGVI
jgi:two-component system NarL family response regulator